MASEITVKKTPTESQFGFGFWFQWVIANAVGLAIGMAAQQFIPGSLGRNRIVIGATVGAAIGVIQILNLKQYVERANRWWVLSSAIGWAVGWSVGWQLYSVIGSLSITEVFALQGAISGALMGLAQWFLMRNQFQYAYWWLIVNIVGWTVGMAIGRGGGAFGFILAGAVGGAITGLILIWLLRNAIDKKLQNRMYATPDEHLESKD